MMLKYKNRYKSFDSVSCSRESYWHATMFKEGKILNFLGTLEAIKKIKFDFFKR